MGTLSLRYSERLIMRFGARTDARRTASADRGRRWPCSRRRRSHGNYFSDVFPVMVLLGIGAGSASRR